MDIARVEGLVIWIFVVARISGEPTVEWFSAARNPRAFRVDPICQQVPLHPSAAYSTGEGAMALFYSKYSAGMGAGRVCLSACSRCDTSLHKPNTHTPPNVGLIAALACRMRAFRAQVR